jgi:CRP-like cAMP-binding protein
MPDGESAPEFALLSLPWINSPDPSPWEGVLELAARRNYRKNEMIIRSGQILDHLYYLRNGEIKTLAVSDDGQQKTVWFLAAGCLFGETPLFNRKPCAYFFQAVTDCEIYLFARETLHGLFARNPAIAFSLVTTLTRKVHILSCQIEDSLFFKPVGRVAKLIYLLFRTKRKAGSDSLPITQEDIAAVLGLHRVTVNQAIKILKHEEILDTRNHQIVVRNADKLKALASGV